MSTYGLAHLFYAGEQETCVVNVEFADCHDFTGVQESGKGFEFVGTYLLLAGIVTGAEA